MIELCARRRHHHHRLRCAADERERSSGSFLNLLSPTTRGQNLLRILSGSARARAFSLGFQNSALAPPIKVLLCAIIIKLPPAHRQC